MTDIKAAPAVVSSQHVTLTQPLEASVDKDLPSGKHPKKDYFQFHWLASLQFFFTEEYTFSYKENRSQKNICSTLHQVISAGVLKYFC